MAITLKLRNEAGGLLVIDDEFGPVGTGRARVSNAHPGFITLTIHFNNPHFRSKKLYVQDFLVLRVPIDWTEEDISLGTQGDDKDTNT